MFPRIVVPDSLIRSGTNWRHRRDSEGLWSIDVFHRKSRTKWNGHPPHDGLKRAGANIVSELKSIESQANPDLGILGKHRWVACARSRVSIQRVRRRESEDRP